MCGCPWRSEEEAGFPEAVVSGGCEPPIWVLGTELRSSIGGTVTFNLLAVSSAPENIFK